MQLSKFSDYSFRALMYLAQNTQGLSTVEQLANELKISQNHLKKIIHKLSKGKFIESYKGRDGGVKIARKPEDIILADVLLYTEANTDFVECLRLDAESSDCPYRLTCNLKGIIDSARSAFLLEFRKYSLKDLLI